MKVGTVPPILHQCSQHEALYIQAFSESLASYSPMPLPLCHFSPSAFDNVRHMHLRVETSKNHAKTKWFGIMSNKYPNGEVTLDISIILGGSRETQKWRLSCQKLNVMEMSEWCPCLPKVSKKRHFPDSNVSE